MKFRLVSFFHANSITPRSKTPVINSYPFDFLSLYKKSYFVVISFATRQKKCIFAIMNFTYINILL